MTAHHEISSYLMGLWAQILRRDVGPNDDFFDVGGDSLTAVRMIVEVQKAYHVEIELETFFEAPSVEKLASLIVTRHA
jgi:acyl carrier protein